MKHRITLAADLEELLQRVGGPHYVYVLCEHAKDVDQPFYVGIGQGRRIFDHEKEASDESKSSAKLSRIREILSRGDEVVRYIDSIHTSDPWIREAHLINQWGLLKDGTGILTNEQRYSPSVLEGGVELRKYAKIGNDIPPNFVRRYANLMVGPEKPNSAGSVYGKICGVLENNHGITGEQLLGLLLSMDFSDIKSAYVASGKVSVPWLCKYVDGGFYKKSPYIQLYIEE